MSKINLRIHMQKNHIMAADSANNQLIDYILNLQERLEKLENNK